MGNVDEQTGGWALTWEQWWSRFRFRIVGTSGSG